MMNSIIQQLKEITRIIYRKIQDLQNNKLMIIYYNYQPYPIIIKHDNTKYKKKLCNSS